jgi:hypothetical protein
VELVRVRNKTEEDRPLPPYRPTSAAVAAQLMLQRKAYVRNTYQFKLGWRYSLLEPMDIVLLTDATLGLAGAAVRITRIDEDDNGELAVTAEEIPGVAP